MHRQQHEIEEENKIVDRARQDPAVFGFLYERYHREIFLFVLRRVDDKQTTDDLTSQVFLKALLALPKYRFRGLPFSAWLYRIATNQIAEYYRTTQRQRVVSIDSGGVQQLMSSLVAPGKTGQGDLIVQLLNHLDEDEVTLIELRFFEDRPFKEVAFILNMTENNAKVKIYRILTKLRKVAERLLQQEQG
jgi:RNA polymerase sigma-70 factor (ECF subfamily)